MQHEVLIAPSPSEMYSSALKWGIPLIFSFNFVDLGGKPRGISQVTFAKNLSQRPMPKISFFEAKITLLSENENKTWGRGYLKRATSHRTWSI